MIDKILLAFSVLRTKTYVVLTDTKAVVMIPLVDINKFDNILLLSAQTAALNEFKIRLNNLIEEHEQQVELISARKDSKLFSKGKERVTKRKK